MTDVSTRPTGVRSKFVTFLVIQLIFVGIALGAITLRGLGIKQERQLPPLRETPLVIGPYYNQEVVITDEQLRRVLRKLRPRFNGKKTVLGHVDHNLRFWGSEAKFDDPTFVSGEDMRQLLTKQAAFEGLYGKDEKPLLIDVPGGGVRVREFEGKASASHDDHTMACLAEAGTTLNYPVVTPERETTFRALVEQSLRDFSLNQVEYEWSSLTYALFVTTDRWITTEGQEISFDMMARRIMRQRMPQGVCMGNHRLHSLVMLLRVDEEHQDILSEDVRSEIIDYLTQRTVMLVQHQHSDGFWNRDWPFETPATSEPTTIEGDRLSDRIIVTGHALEWWALAPPEVHPPRHVLAAAGQWLVREIDKLSDDGIRQNNSFLSHAGRALSLWRGKWPHEVDLTIEAPEQTAPEQTTAEPGQEADAKPDEAEDKKTDDQPSSIDSKNVDAQPSDSDTDLKPSNTDPKGVEPRTKAEDVDSRS